MGRGTRRATIAVVMAVIALGVQTPRARAEEPAPRAPVQVPAYVPPQGGPAPLLGAPPRPPEHLARRWWFWVTLGVAAAGIVTAGLIGFHEWTTNPYSGNASPGRIAAF